MNAEQTAIDKCNLHVIDTEDLLFCVSKDHPLANQKYDASNNVGRRTIDFV